ncbi:MAG: hypothetical protein JJ900_06635 [Rhodospirillales bacterium]|nr:hypothetical protein [Rhodospirillales bacterium]MBO6786513.1 hypothetical protein [Rhodospirillales bacterium]
MVEVSERNTAQRNLLQQLLGQHRNNAYSGKREQQAAYTPKGREIYDTVEISSGAKIVNLGRGLDLARDIRSDRDSTTVQERVRAGSEDISRIGKLFRAVFTGLRSVFGRFY